MGIVEAIIGAGRRSWKEFKARRKARYARSPEGIRERVDSDLAHLPRVTGEPTTDEVIQMGRESAERRGLIPRVLPDER